MIDHMYTDEMVCPYCGCKQTDIYEIKGAYEEDEIRVDCQECEREFASCCLVSYSFTTYEVDKEAEAREEAERKAAQEARHAAARAEAAKWLPGTRVRIREDAEYADWIRSRSGVISNEELCPYGFVSVTLDKTERDQRQYKHSFRSKDLERL